MPSAQIACIELWVSPQTPSQLLLSEEIKVSVEVLREGLKRSNASPNKHLRQSSRQPRKNSRWSTVLQVPASCHCTHPRPAPRSRPPPSSCSRSPGEGTGKKVFLGIMLFHLSCLDPVPTDDTAASPWSGKVSWSGVLGGKVVLNFRVTNLTRRHILMLVAVLWIHLLCEGKLDNQNFN